MKLSIHPHDAESVAELVSRDALPGVPGQVILGLTAFAFCAALVLAIARGGVSSGDDPAEDH